VRRRGWSRRRIAAAVAAAVLAVLVLAQLLLPWIAERVISGRVGRYGHVEAVSVSAWPALQLLWGSADSVHVRAGALALSPGQAANLLVQARHSDRLDAGAETVRLGALQLRDVQLQQRGSLLRAQGLLDARAAVAALGPAVHARVLSSRDGEVLVAVSGLSLLARGAEVRARARASLGRLVVEPLSGTRPLGARLVLFADPRIAVVGIAAEVVSTRPLVYRLSLRARLR
jgi:hypothetical protein